MIANFRHRLPYALICLAAFSVLSGLTGCNTLSSLGLPFGGSSNRLLKQADLFAELPGTAIAELPHELAKSPLPTYVVEIGDSLLVEPISFDATIRLPGDQIVQPDGMISLGEFGHFMCVGKTIDQIEAEVQSRINYALQAAQELPLEVESTIDELEDLSADENLSSEEQESTEKKRLAAAEEKRNLAEVRATQAQRQRMEKLEANRISVRLINWDSQHFYVLGEINAPGSFQYTGKETVLDAIVAAGGLSKSANGHKIVVARPTPSGSCRIVLKTCYDHIVQLGDTSTNYQLQPGDRVFVPTLTFIEDLKQSFSCKNGDKCLCCGPQQTPCIGPRCGLSNSCQSECSCCE